MTKNIIDISLENDAVDVFRITVGEDKIIELTIDLFLVSKVRQRYQKLMFDIANEDEIELLSLFNKMNADELYDDEQVELLKLFEKTQERLEDSIRGSNEFTKQACTEGKEYLEMLNENTVFKLEKMILDKSNQSGFGVLY